MKSARTTRLNVSGLDQVDEANVDAIVYPIDLGAADAIGKAEDVQIIVCWQAHGRADDETGAALRDVDDFGAADRNASSDMGVRQ